MKQEYLLRGGEEKGSREESGGDQSCHLASLGDVVDTKDACTFEECYGVEHGSAVESGVGSGAECAVNHALARDADEERLAERGDEGVKVVEEEIVLLNGLGEAESGVEPDVFDAEGIERVETLGEVESEVFYDVGIVAELLHLGGETACVHEDIRHLELGDSGKHGFVELSAADVVDDVGAGGDGRFSHGSPASVDRDYGVGELLADGEEERLESGGFVGGRGEGDSRLGGDGTDVDDVGAGLEKFATVGHGLLGRGIEAAVVEGVGADVEDAHDDRPVESDNFFVTINCNFRKIRIFAFHIIIT